MMIRGGQSAAGGPTCGGRVRASLGLMFFFISQSSRPVRSRCEPVVEGTQRTTD